MEKLFVWWEWKKGNGKHFCGGDSKATAVAEMSIQKCWKHYSLHDWEIQLSAALLSLGLHSMQLRMKGLKLDSAFVPFSWHSQLTLGSRLDVSVVKCNGYSNNTPVALWHRREAVCHLWTPVPMGSCVTFTAPSATEWTTRGRHSALCLPLSLPLFSGDSSCQACFVRALQKETMPCKTKAICCACRSWTSSSSNFCL